MVREFNREEDRKVRIIFDNPAKGVLGNDAYEDAINFVASLSWRLVQGDLVQRDLQLSFVSQGYSEGSDVYAFLKHLAVVQPGAKSSLLETLNVSEDFNIVVTTVPHNAIPGHLQGCS